MITLTHMTTPAEPRTAKVALFRTKRAACLAPVLAVAALLGGCASNAPNASVENARAVVGQTANNPEVARRAPLELKAARDSLDAADAVWNKNRDDAEASHLAYLATRKAEIARNLARSRQTDDDVKEANSAGDKLRLEARTREAEQARLAALNAQNQATSAQQQARESQAQAATAQQDALAANRIAAAERAQSIAAQDAAAAERARANQATSVAMAAQDRIRDLEEQLRDIEARQTERGLLVTLGDVLFAFNKADLTAQAAPRLDKLASFLKQFSQRKLLIEGYTDGVGSDAYNNELSQRRAETVRDALILRGVEPTRIITKGYGKAYPVADNGNPEGRAMNRRVEVVIADERGLLKGRGV